MFLLFLGRILIEHIILRATNKALPKHVAKISFGEFLRWLCLLAMNSTSVGFTWDDYWESEESRIEKEQKCPYNFNPWMSRRRFQLILQHLNFFTILEPPNYQDNFFHVRQMIGQWNKNMRTVFLAWWVCCLDESMSLWTNRWTGPGWVFCPGKLFPFGNKYHTMCCAVKCIMFVIDLVKGRDCLSELPSLDPGRLRNTVSLLLRMYKTIVGTGKVLILDSGFCVLNGLIQLMKRGFYAGALHLRRGYILHHILIFGISRYFSFHMKKKLSIIFFGSIRIHCMQIKLCKYLDPNSYISFDIFWVENYFFSVHSNFFLPQINLNIAYTTCNILLHKSNHMSFYFT